jgi:hypothetical protein
MFLDEVAVPAPAAPEDPADTLFARLIDPSEVRRDRSAAQEIMDCLISPACPICRHRLVLSLTPRGAQWGCQCPPASRRHPPLAAIGD